MRRNPVFEQSEAFGDRMVRMYNYLCNERKETVMSRQVYRSGTSIGANIAEARFAASRADFVNKMRIALKEAGETLYWLDRLQTGQYLTAEMHRSIRRDCESLVAMLISIINTTSKKP